MPDFPINPGHGTTTFHGHITLNTHATLNTKSTPYLDIIAATAADYDGLIVSANPFVNGVSYLIDIAVGALSSEQIILPDWLLCGGIGIPACIYIPCNIPEGTRLSVRGQSSTGNSNIYINVIGVTGGLWGAPSGGRIVNLAATPATSKGILLDAGAVANTYPASYTQIIASTTEDIAALWIGAGSHVNTAPQLAAQRIQIGVGAAASEQLIHEMGLSSNITTWSGPPPFWLPSVIPAGSRIAARVRSTTNDATDRVSNVQLMGLVI